MFVKRVVQKKEEGPSLTGPSSGDGGADSPRPPPIAGRLPTIMLPYSSPPPDTMLDMSATAAAVVLVPAVFVLPAADKPLTDPPPPAVDADCPMLTGGRLLDGGGNPDMMVPAAAAVCLAGVVVCRPCVPVRWC